MMQQVNAFQTSDGRLFDDSNQAERHEMFLKKQMVVEEFLSSELNPYKSHAQRSIARSTVINWELWKTKNAK
jgi:hypothetical protein